MIVITVHGIPAPQGSKNVNRYGATYEVSKRVKPWREAVKFAALGVIEGYAGWVPMDGPLTLYVIFYFDRPERPSAAGRRPRVPPGSPRPVQADQIHGGRTDRLGSLEGRLQGGGGPGPEAVRIRSDHTGRRHHGGHRLTLNMGEAPCGGMHGASRHAGRVRTEPLPPWKRGSR